MDHSPTLTAIGLGANLGIPQETVRKAAALLVAGGLRNARCSSLYQSEPEGCRPGDPDFVNAVLVGEWPATAEDLLAYCRDCERRLGRPPEHGRNEPRTIDLDILVFGARIVSTPRLTIPHPRMRNRLFVLVPLAEIAPDLTLPPDGIAAAAARDQLKAALGQEEVHRRIRRIAPPPLLPAG